MNRNFPRIVLFLAIAGTAASCSKVESDNVKTSGLYASFSVDGNNQSTVTCRAIFQVGGPTGTYVDLKRGDKVSCNGAEMTRIAGFEGSVSYKADVAFNPGSQYKIVFTRPGEPTYESMVELPPKISGMNPGAAFAVRKGTVLNPSWQPSSSGIDEMNVELAYRYSDGITERSGSPAMQRDPSPERGGVGFGAGDTSRSPQPAGVWSGSLTYARLRHGEVASGLNGLLTASQTAVVPMQLTD